MNDALLPIAIGGAIGAVTRFLIAKNLNALLGPAFPYGTLAVNVLGCFLMGFLAVLMLEILALSFPWRAAILIGFLGGLTTFSAFSFESLDLLLMGEFGKATMNVLANVFLCLFATWLGMLLARS